MPEYFGIWTETEELRTKTDQSDKSNIKPRPHRRVFKILRQSLTWPFQYDFTENDIVAVWT